MIKRNEAVSWYGWLKIVTTEVAFLVDIDGVNIKPVFNQEKIKVLLTDFLK